MREDFIRLCTESNAKPDDLMAMAEALMPFGRYQGRLLIDLQESYLLWLSWSGFPKNKLGRMLRTVYEIKINGSEYLLEPLRHVRTADGTNANRKRNRYQNRTSAAL